MAIISKNPATEEMMMTFEELSDDQVEEKLGIAQNAFELWRKTSFMERRMIFKKVAEILRGKKEFYGEMMTREMGKPIGQAVAEAEKCAWVCDFYAEEAENFLTNSIVKTELTESYVKYDPLGIILAIMPWNFPFLQAIRFAAPTLMAGNVAVLKHASNVPQCALEVEKLFLEAGLPTGVFQTLLIGSGKIAGLIGDPRIQAVTLTGSEGAGSQVAMEAGRNIKKSVLELGGSDPFIVFSDADIDDVVANAVIGRTQNNGQSCIGAKRFILMRDIADKFLEGFKAAFERLVVGNPLDPATQIGPLADVKFRDGLIKQIDESVKAGAQILTGGKAIQGPGAFLEPTILVNIKKGMPAYNEEFFGPVALVIVVESEEEAIKVANDTSFGLGASMWTGNMENAKKYISEIDSGLVFVNAIVKSDPRLPFGGVKRSGYGREMGECGIYEFVNAKTVVIK